MYPGEFLSAWLNTNSGTKISKNMDKKGTSKQFIQNDTWEQLEVQRQTLKRTHNDSTMLTGSSRWQAGGNRFRKIHHEIL